MINKQNMYVPQFEFWQNEVGGVEVNVGQHITHHIVDDMTQTA